MQTFKDIAHRIHETYGAIFGRTPLRERLEDIAKQAEQLHRSYDVTQMREKASNLLASTIELCNENYWSVEDLIAENLKRIRKRELQYRTLGRKKEIALFGGAFDPITKAHEAVGRFVLQSTDLFDEVWFMPCSTHLYGKDMAPAGDRLAMCELVASGNPRFKAFDFEIQSKLRGETYKTVKMLLNSSLAEEHNFSLIIGQDNANSIEKWYNWEHLLQIARFIVVPRKGEQRDPNVDWYLKRPHVYLSPDNEIPELSSTIVRGELQEYYGLLETKTLSTDEIDSQKLQEHLHPSVLQLIISEQLYSGKVEKV